MTEKSDFAENRRKKSVIFEIFARREGGSLHRNATNELRFEPSDSSSVVETNKVETIFILMYLV
jgi:hypothetical protein